MKTLKKALDILELVSVHAGHPVTPTMVSQELHLTPSTCVRMMKTLSECGYLWQVSSRAGYVVGPNLVTCSCRESIFNTMVHAAKVPIENLSREVHAIINLSVMYHQRRYVIYHYGYTPGIDLRAMMNYTRQWNYSENGTERLLLAVASRPDRERFISQVGLPESFASMEELHVELDALKQAGCVKFHSIRQGLWVVSALMTTQHFPAASIGFGVSTEEEADRALVLSRQCCEQIGKNLMGRMGFP